VDTRGGEGIRDLTDAEARVALPQKWGSVDPDVLPSWVAEMDFAVAPPVVAALHDAVARGRLGYPSMVLGLELGEAYTGFAARHHIDSVRPIVIPVVDVTAGIRFALDVLSEPAPVVVPFPAYPPHHDVAQITGRERIDLTLDPDAPHAAIDLDELDQQLRGGARTLLLTNPHNPWGRVFTRAELEGVRDVVVEHGARVISDEIHAPLTLPGATFTSYLSIEGTSDHAVALVSASKAFNIAGLRCAQILTTHGATLRQLIAAPVAQNDSWSTLGAVATIAAYRDCDVWLASLVDRLDSQRGLLAELLAEHLPAARMRPLEGSYLAWVDLRGYGVDDPAAVALERGRVQLAAGHEFQPDLTGHGRVNIATSPDRLREIVQRLTAGLT
jgi:cystathionine beta-lyase